MKISIVRPTSGGEVALNDDDLARIGMAVVFEAAAKSVAASALGTLSRSISYWAARRFTAVAVTAIQVLASRVANARIRLLTGASIRIPSG